MAASGGLLSLVRVISLTMLPEPIRSGLHQVSVSGLEAWGDWGDSLGVAHSAIQSKKEPFVYSTIGSRDLDNIQLEFAVEV